MQPARKPLKDDPWSRVAPLVLAALAEAACVGGGVAAFLLTGKVVWLVFGVVVGLAVFVPGMLRFLAKVKEQRRASR
jgi:hypothetical protein